MLRAMRKLREFRSKHRHPRTVRGRSIVMKFDRMWRLLMIGLLVVSTLLTMFVTAIVGSYLFGEAKLYQLVIRLCDQSTLTMHNRCVVIDGDVVDFEKIRGRAIRGDVFSIVLLSDTYEHGYYGKEKDLQMMKRTRTLLGVKGAPESYLSEMIDTCEKVYLHSLQFKERVCTNSEPLLLWSEAQKQIMDYAITVNEYDREIVFLLIGSLLAEFIGMVKCLASF